MKKMQHQTVRQKTVSVLVAAALVASVMAPAVSAVGTTPAAPGTSISFANISSDGGANKISMTNTRTFEVVVPLSAGQDAQALIDSGLSWDLSRTEGICDPEQFPHQYLGGPLTEWKVYGTDDPLFTIKKTEASTTSDGTPAIKMTFSNEYLFGMSSVGGRNYTVRNQLLDYTGDFTLTCSANGNILGSTSIQVNPYDDYRTTSEFSEELVEATSAAAANGLYAEVHSMGTSTNGLDMPYIVIADEESTVTDWQKLLSESQENPQAALDKLGSGNLDYKVPILYSNVHSDECPGADAPMNFIWDLVDGAKASKTYQDITSFTAEGQAKVKSQRATRGQHTPALIQDYTTFKGAITAADNSESSAAISDEDMQKYYNIETKTFDVDALLDDVFFIIVPEENVDGRTHNTRTAGGGVDLNRDNLFQTQKETQNMTDMISDWNPVAFMEFHGFVGSFQVEPCSPPHEPNVEYDLFAQMAMGGGEAFGASAVTNNGSFNSYEIPLRDYLYTNGNGQAEWIYPWDDMSTNYTPQYSLLHGTVAYTVEVPDCNQDGVLALEYGMMGHSKQVADNKEIYLKNVLMNFKRGVENIDDDAVRPWYVDRYDTEGAEADVFRPRSEENNNFFPEYYVIPLDLENQRNLDAANEMDKYFLRNNVAVSKLTEDTTVNGTTYKAGSLVIDMHQAKRNVANAVLYDGVVMENWPTLYSEPITAFDKTRGFDCSEIRAAGAFEGKLTPVTKSSDGTTVFDGQAGNAVVISNNGTAAIQAVNSLLDNGKTVGYITEGKYKSNFAVSYADFLTVKDRFILNAYGVDESPVCTAIKKPTLYIVGRPAQNTSGYIYYSEKGNNIYNFNRIAFTQDLGFTTTDDPAKADVIVANQYAEGYEYNAVMAAIQSGTPTIITGTSSLKSILGESFANQFGCTYNAASWNNYDCLTTVTYPSDSMTTDSYKLTGDNILYGFGGDYFQTLPEGAVALIQNTSDYPMEGFISGNILKNYYGKTVALSYNTTTDDASYDLTLFANTLTNKVHQKDDYRYATNTIYSKMLGEAVTIPVTTEESSSSSSSESPSSGSENSSSGSNSSAESESSPSALTSASASTNPPVQTGDVAPIAGIVVLLGAAAATAYCIRRKKH